MAGGQCVLTFETLALFKERGHHMDISKLQVFLSIARNPHCSRMVLEEETGITQSSISRITRSLGAGLPRSKQAGLGLVVGYSDREDPRRLCYVLSAEGRKLYRDLGVGQG